MNNTLTNLVIVVLLGGMLLATITSRTASNTELDGLKERLHDMESLLIETQETSGLVTKLASSLFHINMELVGMKIGTGVIPSSASESHFLVAPLILAGKVTLADMKTWTAKQVLSVFTDSRDWKIEPGLEEAINETLDRHRSIIAVIEGLHSQKIDALVAERDLAGDYATLSLEALEPKKGTATEYSPNHIIHLRRQGTGLRRYAFDVSANPQLVEDQKYLSMCKINCLNEIYFILTTYNNR